MRMDVRRVVAIVLLAGAVARAEQPATRPADKSPGQPTPIITITGRRSPVEQGERPIFVGLPPRDLMARPLTESPGLDTATTVVGQDEIRWLDAFTVVDALKYVPGGWTETRGRKVKKFFSIRGQRYPYPGYLLDGTWFREFHETNFFLSAANVERIELLRSSAALLVSPGGMTGMVNVIPRTYTEMETRIDAVFGEHGTARTQLSHGNAVGNLSYALGLGYHHTDGEGHMNAGENITNLYGRVVWEPPGPWTLSFTGASFFGDRHLKLAEPPASPILRTRRDWFDPMHTYLLAAKARYQPDERAATEISANYALRRFHGHRQGSDDWLEEDYEYNLRLMQALKLCEGNTLRFGGMFNHWASPTGKRFYVGRRCDLRTYSGVIVDEHEFGRLTLNAGCRVSRTYVNDFGGLNIEGSGSGLTSVRIKNEWEDPLYTVTLGLSYALTDDVSLHANASRGQISSTPGMLTDDGQRPGTETRTKFDLGVKRAWDAFGEASLTAFYVGQKDAAVLSGGFVTVDGVDFGLFENADRRSWGLELDVRSKRFDSGLQFFLNAVAMSIRRRQDGRWVRDKEVPQFILAGGLSYLIKDFEISLLAKRVCPYENERFLPGGSDPAPLGDYTELGAKATYFFGPDKADSVFVGIDNICNKEYSTVAGFPNDGLQFKGGVSLKF